MSRSPDIRTIAFYALLAVGFVAAIYHVVDGRIGNGILAFCAVGAGLFIQRELSSRQEAPRPAPATEAPSKPERERPSLREQVDAAPQNRTDWLTNSILAGFAAMIVMTMVFIGGFVFSGLFAQEDGNLLQRWFHGLTNNALTDGAYDVPLAAYSINLLAALVWAIVYGAIVHPRLSGPGWTRGVIFSIAPWFLSLVVFFPVVGAGLFGADLGAGPLPALGNLILHLVYGATLGFVFALPERALSDAVAADERQVVQQNRGMAIGLVTGLVAGVIAGSALGVFVSSDFASPIELVLAGAASGTMIGAVAGPLIGLSAGVDEGTASTTERRSGVGSTQ